jgi:16S rRNA (cytidine1402-2'-O)-methyltransferase
VTAALVLAGLPTDRFLFLGFLSPKPAARRAEVVAVKGVRASLVLFEAPSRLVATLRDLAACLGERPAAVARELTKLHEEVRRGSLIELAQALAQEPTPKGEIVIVVAPPGTESAAEVEDLDVALRTALASASLKAAVAEVTARLGLPRRVVYARALVLTAETR